MKKIHKEDESRILFFILWGDVLSLMLVFFVILFSMSTLDERKIATLSQSIESSLSEEEFVILMKEN